MFVCCCGAHPWRRRTHAGCKQQQGSQIAGWSAPHILVMYLQVTGARSLSIPGLLWARRRSMYMNRLIAEERAEIMKNKCYRRDFCAF